MKPAAFLLLLAAACAPRNEPPDDIVPPAEESASADFAPKPTEAPAGRYTVEKSHASLLFRVDHLGFSMYTARFKSFDATLDLDPAAPEKASLVASVDAASIETDFPYPDMEDFNATLAGPDWLDAAAHPQMTFRSTAIEMTGPDTARVTGDLSIRGVTRPFTLEARFNGGYKGFAPYDPNARIGFSARGVLQRSAFGVSYGVPTPQSPLGVGDDVEVIIEAEFTGPALADSGAGAQ